jgi:hypothetical protein
MTRTGILRLLRGSVGWLCVYLVEYRVLEVLVYTHVSLLYLYTSYVPSTPRYNIRSDQKVIHIIYKLTILTYPYLNGGNKRLLGYHTT